MPFMKRLHTLAAGKALARWWSQHGRDESGAEVIEFGICANLYMVFCIGFLLLCGTLFSLHCVGEASREAARWASVRGTTSSASGTCVDPNIATCAASSSDVQTFVKTRPGLASSATVTVNWCNSDGTTGCTTSESNAIPGNIVKVKVTSTYLGISLTSTAEKVIWQ
jgi:Flp pilus assembly protein TadG